MARYKHGRYSAEAKARWKEAKMLMAECDAFLKQLGDNPFRLNDPGAGGYRLAPDWDIVVTKRTGNGEYALPGSELVNLAHQVGMISETQGQRLPYIFS